MNDIYLAEHRRLGVVPSVAQMESAESVEAYQGESLFPGRLHPGHSLRYHSTDVCQSR